MHFLKYFLLNKAFTLINHPKINSYLKFISFSDFFEFFVLQNLINMEIIVKSDLNIEAKLTVDPEEPICKIKSKLFEIFKIAASCQLLEFNGKYLDFDKSFKEQDVYNGAIIMIENFR